jgi:hypothetical protein
MRILHPWYAELWLARAARNIVYVEYKTMSFKNDYNFGLQAEDSVMSRMAAHFDTELTKTDQFNPFDFKSSKMCIELKTRRNAKDKYPTTMVGANKVRIAEEDTSGKRYLFAFNFTDGLYYVEYDRELFSGFEIKQGGRFDRGRPELNEYCYIPVSCLKLMSENPI